MSDQSRSLDSGTEQGRTSRARLIPLHSDVRARGPKPPLVWRLGAGSGPVGLLDAVALAVAVAVTGAATSRSLAWMGAVLVVAICWGCYRPRVTPTLRSETPRLVAASVTASLAVALASPSFISSLRELCPVAIVLLVLGRASAYRIQGTARSHCKQRVLILGSGELGCKLSRTIEEHPSCGFEVVGIVDGYDIPLAPAPIPVIGELSELETLIDVYQARTVIIAFGSDSESDMVDVLRACRRRDLDVFVVPRLFELGVGGGAASGDELWGFPLTRVSQGAMPGGSWAVKRALDVILSAGALVLLSPLFAAAAIGVKLSSPGPVFFKQPRVGQRGRTVSVLKFRSMPVIEDSDTRWQVDDHQIPWFGNFIRKTSIDELPQLINVLRGDMSLVGPRPEREHYVNKFSDEIARYGARHRVPVGLTGWAQVHGLRGDTSIEDRARFDNYYIEHWSVWLDLVIMARTVGHVLRTVAGWRRDRSEAQPKPAGPLDLTVTPDLGPQLAEY